MPKPQILLVSSKPIFNLDLIAPLGTLTTGDTSILFSVLLQNTMENISSIKSDLEFSVFIDQKDQDSVPEEIKSADLKYFVPASGYNQLSDYILKKIHSGNTQFIIIFANTIGFSPNEYNKAINFLNYDDNAILLGKSPDEKTSLIAFNYYDQKLFENICDINPDIDTLVRRINPMDYFLFIQNGYQFVNNLDDFRKLYRMLSTKESIEYCSHHMHEQFTHLFIEYKESL